MTDWPREPLHPAEPSPLDVARVVANPINWWRLGMACHLRMLGEIPRRLR